MGWIMAVFIALLLLGVIIYVAFVVRYLGSDNKKAYIQEPAPGNAPTVIECYLRVNISSKETKWKENFLDQLSPEICEQVIQHISDILFDYIDSKDDYVNYKDLKSKVITISFTVEINDAIVSIKGLDDFQTDLNNNVYSTVECSTLIQVLTQLQIT